MIHLFQENNSPLDHLMEGFQLIGHDWRYRYVNNAAAKQGKYHKEELLGFTMMEKYPGIDKSPMFKRLYRSMQVRVSDHFDNEFTFPDGTKGWFELRVHPVPEGIFVLSIDITDRKIAEQSHKDYIQDLEEMMFITSHRVRQPITNMLGIMHLLESSDLSLEELRITMGSLKHSIQSLDLYTRELTDHISSLNQRHQNTLKAWK